MSLPRYAIRLADIVNACELVRAAMGEATLIEFSANWQKQWMVERGLLIISEASRRVPDTFKDRHPHIPWRNVAGIGNILRHDYESIAADIIWALVRSHLSALEDACRAEWAALTDAAGASGMPMPRPFGTA